MTTATKAKRETWREWMPEGAPEPDRLFTRDEIVDRVALRHVAGTEPIAASDLRYWEHIGVLPQGIRKWHEGAPRVFYPAWYGDLARQIRLLQRLGHSLDEIRPRIRAHARIALGLGDTDEDADIRRINRHAQGPEGIVLWTELTDELQRLARYHEALSGAPTHKIVIRVIPESGPEWDYPYQLADSPPINDNDHDE